jgi:drug/metabolite transporter (DMT)-like permease
MQAYLFAAVPILLWASTPLLVTELAEELPVFQVNWLVTGFSILSLSTTLTAYKRWNKLRDFSRSDWGTALLLGVTGLFPYTTLYYLAFALAPEAAGTSNIINYLWPIWIVVLAVPILKERLSWKKILGIALSFTGVYLILTGGMWVRLQLDHLPAYLSAGAGALFWGLFSVQNKRHRFDALPAMWIYNVGAFPCFAAAAVIASPLIWPTPRGWLLLFLLGGIVNGFSYLFWILALRRGETAKIANLVYITPFLALAYLAAFRGTQITATQLLALLLVIAGPVLQEIRAPRTSKSRKEEN